MMERLESVLSYDLVLDLLDFFAVKLE